MGGNLICPKCRSISVVKNGMGHTKVQHYKCNECDYNFPITILNKVKTLIFDIENAPVEAYVWNKRVWNTSISPKQLKHDWFMLTWSAKWLNSPKTYSFKLTPKEAKERNDERITKALWNLFDEANIIIAHNAWRFDIPMANTKFIIHKLNPPSPYQIIDTLKIAKKIGSFTYNSLDFLGETLGLGRKIETEFQLWVDCVNGKASALKEMAEYNIQDVILLEEVYLRLRGWMNSHPNLNLFQNESGCSHCGSMKIKYAGEYAAQTRTFKSFRCLDCGGFSRETKKSYVSTAR